MDNSAGKRIRNVFIAGNAQRWYSLLIAGVFLCITAATTWAAIPASDTFYGVRLGETTKQLRGELGHTTLTAINEHATFWSYLIDDGKAWRAVIIQNDRVVGVYVRQEFGRVSHLSDGQGLAIGDSITRMFAQRGVTGPLVNSTYAYSTDSGVYRLYEVTNGIVTAMGITRAYDYPLPIFATWDQHDGVTWFRAYVLGKDDYPIEKAELGILNAEPCNNEGSWRLMRSSRFFLYGHHYDRVLAACSVPVYRRKFYFDVTAALKAVGPASVSTTK